MIVAKSLAGLYKSKLREAFLPKKLRSGLKDVKNEFRKIFWRSRVASARLLDLLIFKNAFFLPFPSSSSFQISGGQRRSRLRFHFHDQRAQRSRQLTAPWEWTKSSRITSRSSSWPQTQRQWSMSLISVTQPPKWSLWPLINRKKNAVSFLISKKSYLDSFWPHFQVMERTAAWCWPLRSSTKPIFSSGWVWPCQSSSLGLQAGLSEINGLTVHTVDLQQIRHVNAVKYAIKASLISKQLENEGKNEPPKQTLSHLF